MLNKSYILKELELYKVTENDFSINEGLKYDAYILEKLNIRDVNSIWKFFYNDEKGNQTEEKYFKTEKEAILFLIEILKEEFSHLKSK